MNMTNAKGEAVTVIKPKTELYSVPSSLKVKK